MRKNQKLFVSRYMPYGKSKKKHDNYTFKLISITALICTILIGTMVILARQLPKNAFVTVLMGNKSKQAEPEKELYVYPEPDDSTRAKANRLREIRYEDYLSHCYTPLSGELDNVYVYDNHKKCYLTFDDGPSTITAAPT